MSAHEEEQLAETALYARGRFQVLETRYLVDGWDTERGVELWYGNGEDVDARILVGLRWSAGRGWRMSTDMETRGLAMPTEDAPHMADALEAMARAVRTL
jgi:hypothetical protein